MLCPPGWEATNTGPWACSEGREDPLTRKVFIKLMGLFVLLLVFHTVVLEIVFRRLVAHRAGESLNSLDREALWSGFIALAEFE